MFDYDAAGKVIGIEVLDVGSRVTQNALSIAAE